MARQSRQCRAAAGAVSRGGLEEAAATAKMALGGKEGEAQQHQHQAQGGGAHQVVAPGHLHVHRPREGRVTQDRHGAEVGHDVQADEKQARRHRRPLHRQHHPQPGAPAPGAGQPRRLFVGDVGAHEGGAAQQVNVGIGGQAENQHGAGKRVVEGRQLRVRPQQALYKGAQGAPVGEQFRVHVGHDVGRDAERRRQQPGPQAAGGKIVAHHQPGQADAAGQRDDRHARRQAQGVEQQFRHPALPQLDPDLARHQQGVAHHVGQRHDDEQGHRKSNQAQRLGAPGQARPRRRNGDRSLHA